MSADYGIKDEYEKRYPILKSVASRLEDYIKNLVAGEPRIDAVTARAKDPERYFIKALKQDDDGGPKYTNPKYEIQDQIGARLTVLYLSDVERIKQIVVKSLRFIEQQEKKPDKDEAFGYVGLHFIINVPDDVVPDDVEDDVIPDFFELQIKTLFQHAWSEAHHDLGYKAFRDLSSDERRKIAFTAAQAWGADNIFEELAKTLVTNDN